jgi:hypothetical protein
VSIRALTYARHCLRSDAKLTTADRLVFMLLADSSNHRTGQAYTGTWLAEQAAIDMRSVRRVLHRLRDAGHIRIEERIGAASVVTFPMASYLSTTPDSSVRGEQTRAPDTHVRGPLTPGSPIPGTHTADDNSSTYNLEVVAGEAWCCDSTGWVYDEATHTVTECPTHHPRALKARS